MPGTRRSSTASPRARGAPLLLLLALGCADRAPTVVFMTDFGVADDSVAICKGVMLEAEPRLRIVDLTHDVRPYAIADAARFLAGTTPYYPPGTIFLAVVDPGVGTERRAIVARSGRGQYFVVPDNGLLTLVADRDGLDQVREIEDPAWLAQERTSHTFHGRDVFAPVVGRLAHGDDWQDVGPVLSDIVRLALATAEVTPSGVRGEAIALDGPFGNVVTNVEEDALAPLGYPHPGGSVRLRLGTQELTVPYVATFADVPVGRPCLYVDSRRRLALAVNRGNFATTYEITPPLPLIIFPRDSGGE